MIELRQLNDKGIAKFKDFFDKVYDSNEPEKVIKPDLNLDEFSINYKNTVFIDENAQFNTKKDLAGYLYNLFFKNNIERKDIIEINNLWTWLAYLWFDQLTNNRKSILKRSENYICSKSNEYRRFYIHLVAGPYNIYCLLKDDAKAFLYNKVWNSNEFFERVAPNQFLITHPNIIRAINTLYFDEEKGEPKKYYQIKTKPGNLRRFIKVIQQFELTYDIYSMDENEIIDLLPDDEFINFKPLTTQNQ